MAVFVFWCPAGWDSRVAAGVRVEGGTSVCLSSVVSASAVIAAAVVVERSGVHVHEHGQEEEEERRYCEYS